MWIGYFSHQAYDGSIKPTTEICTVPVFQGKAATAAMIKQTSNVCERVTAFLIPGQTPVTGCDVPLYAMGNTS